MAVSRVAGSFAISTLALQTPSSGSRQTGSKEIGTATGFACPLSLVKCHRVTAFQKACSRLPSIFKPANFRDGTFIRQALPDDTEEASTSGSDDDTPPSTSELDWREFRARLVARSAVESLEREREEPLEPDTDLEKAAPHIRPGGSWAHSLVLPERGGLVIAKPGFFSQNQQYFNNAVIMLLHIGEEGSMGIILNKPTGHTLGSLFDGIDTLAPELASGLLYLGGDVGQGATHVLHGFADLEGAQKLVEGVYAGGFEAISGHIREGKSRCEDYRFFHMFAGWGPGQLETEVKAGVWYLGSCSKDLLLNHPEDSQRPLWEEVLRLMGGIYAEAAEKGPKDTP